MSVNYFAAASAAERYAKARPFFHPLIVEKICAACGIAHVVRALDVGCGTGQSTQALAEIADEAVGVDLSASMLSQAAPHKRIRYIVAPAEKIPLDDATFDLITVGLAFHWFDQAAFLSEARRLLKPEGWLVIYNDGFSGQMKGNPDFARWSKGDYPARYPTPARKVLLPAWADASKFGFAETGEDSFVHSVEFSPQQLVDYLMTQSNVIAAVENGSEDIASVAAWLLTGAASFFTTPTEIFYFGGNIRFLRRD